VIDNVVWIDSWLSIAGAGCSLTGVGASEEQVIKNVVWTDSWLSIAGAGCSLTGVGGDEEQA
jgi:hypothetical protein